MANSHTTKRQREREKAHDLEGFYREFQQESDRATAILGAALLDETLKELLAAFFVDCQKEVDELLEDSNGISALGIRMRLAYCLGLLTREAFDALKIIKNIRNDFAHHLHGLAFNDPRIEASCERLRSDLDLPTKIANTARNRFILSVFFIHTEMWSMIESIDASKVKRTVRPSYVASESV